MNILVIDNDPIFLKFAEKFLIEEGHTVKSARDGLSALDVLKAFTPDFFFVDYVMPNIDGGVFCQILKNDPKYKSAYLVLLSAIAAEEWTDLSDLGADACIAKGPLNNMKGYIAEVINNPAASAKYCAGGGIIGLQDVFPRLITRELLDSKKHFHLLLNKMLEGILEISADNRVVFVNPVAQRIVGRPRDAILGSRVGDIFPGVQSRFLNNLLNSKERCEPAGTTSDLISIGQKFVTLKVVPLMSADKHALVILNDVSAYKNAENKLTETNSFLQSILNSAYSISIISTDLDQNIIFWNRGAEELFGYTAEEVVGKHKISILYPGSQEEDLSSDLRHQLQHAKKEVDCELTEKTKDGRMLWMKLHLSPRVDEGGEVVGILGIGEDISQQKKAETEVRESGKRLRMFSELAKEGIVIHDQGDIIDANDAIAGLFEYEPAEIIGMSVKHLVAADTWSVILENLSSGYEGHFEGTGIRKGGATFDCFMAGRSYQYRGRSLRVATFRDITARKKLETKLYQAQKMKALGTLAGGVAHDFNNLLMGI
ncbi:MAG: PAS domain S-box protein, partial [Desulfobacterales bacterium]|nr:PAS domain S-box protein [Desulfobacterales bacterium]